MKTKTHTLFSLVVSLLALSLAANVSAQQIIPAPPHLNATAYLLIDANTGEVLVESHSGEKIPPASLTKLMTSYVVSSEIGQGNLGEDELVNISVRAWKMAGSKMFIREGTRVSVRDLVRGVIIQSGNDASVALAEHIAGSEEAFVDVMNQQAALLGMANTQFKNATGWPAEGHYTTAKDLSLLARAIINDHPEHYKIYSEKSFKYNGIAQDNRNKLLFLDDSIDGLKTGHTNAAGYCLVASGVKNNMRLISVVMGTRSEKARAVESQKLMAYGFRYFETHQLFESGEMISSQRVWKGKVESVNLGVAEGVLLTIPRRSQERIKTTTIFTPVIQAPVKRGQALGSIKIELDGKLLAELPLVALEPIEEAGFFSRLWSSVKLFFFELFV